MMEPIIRIFVFFLGSILFSGEIVAQIKCISILDYGATPNDNKSDQAAFNSVSDYINARKGYVKLIVPEGKYLVGPLYDYNTFTKTIPRGKVWDVIKLENVSNVTIEGVGNVQIKFLDGIPVGTVPNLPKNTDSAVHVGSCVRIINSKDISVSNLHADGNNQKFRLLKTWGAGANPYEREHDGLFILNCQNVKVQNCSFNSFVRDGIMIIQDADKLPVKNISVRNSKFNFNGRNGLSWCGGEDVSFNLCEFNFNATGKIITNPACGIDIEPERYALCRKGRFINCIMDGNGGYAMGSGYNRTNDIVFTGCNFIGDKNYAVILGSQGFKFKDCIIAGTSGFTYNGENQKDGTQFVGCTFTDSLLNKKVFRENYMVAIRGRFVKFANCKFISYKLPSIYTEIVKKAGKENAENTLFENCVFKAKFKKNSTWGKLALLASNSKFKNCTFETDGFADFKSNLKSVEKNIDIDNSNLLK